MNKQKKGEDLELKYLRLKYLSEEELNILASIRKAYSTKERP